jgi:hypothetical protein
MASSHGRSSTRSGCSIPRHEHAAHRIDMSGAGLPFGRRLLAIATAVAILVLAALVGQVAASIIGVGLRLDETWTRATLDLVVVLATLVLAARALTSSVLPRFATDYELLRVTEARRLTIAAGGVLGAGLLVTLPLVAPPEVGAVALVPGVLVAAATAGGALLAPAERG